MVLQVNAERLRADLLKAASFGKTATGAVNRPAFSQADVEVRKWFSERANEAGLEARTDSLLNVIVGDPSDRPGVWTGSHLDTVPDGGMFDGALGAIAGLECVRRIHEEKIPLARPIRTVAFSDEEGSYLGFLGSMGLVDGLAIAREPGGRASMNQPGYGGKTLKEALFEAGGDLNQASSAQLPAGIVQQFIELHVEQGPWLEDQGTEIGVVSHIVGVGRGTVEFLGRPDHAGTTPMHMRRDALRGAAKFISQLTKIPAIAGCPEAVITCGILELLPGAANVVPERVSLELDYRDISTARLQKLEESIIAEVATCSTQAGVEAKYTSNSMTPPVVLDTAIAGVIEENAVAMGLSHAVMPSGAGHDSQIMAQIAPTGMIFVPSHEGRSHSWLEHTEWEDVVNGANVLLNTLLAYAGGRPV